MAEKDRIRTEQFRFTLLPEESAMLTKNAFEHGLSKADYLRKMILLDSVLENFWTMDKEQGKELLYELNRIGNNINQIAYNTNSQRYASGKDWQELEKSYYELLSVLGKIPFLQKGEIEEWQQQIFTLLHKRSE